MRASKHAKGSIRLIGIIEVQANREHGFQQRHRRLHVRHTFL